MFEVREFVSGNGRNRCAGVFDGENCVACYHMRDVGKRYLSIAQAHADRLNAERAS